MAKILAVMDDDGARGFRLAGVEACVAPDGAAAARILETALADRETAVVVVDEDLFEAVGPELLPRLERSLKPVFVPLPRVHRWGEGEAREDYLGRLLRRVIGYQIKLKT